MRSFRKGNFIGLQNNFNDRYKRFDTRGFDVDAAEAARSQAQGTTRSQRYYRDQDMLDRRLRPGSQYQGIQDTSFGEQFLQENYPGINFGITPGNQMKKPFQMKANPFSKKYKK